MNMAEFYTLLNIFEILKNGGVFEDLWDISASLREIIMKPDSEKHAKILFRSASLICVDTESLLGTTVAYSHVWDDEYCRVLDSPGSLWDLKE